MPARSRRSIFSLQVSALAFAVVAAASAAHAQTIINGTTETTPPFVVPINDDLFVGTTGTGVLNIVSGGVVTTSTILGDSVTGNGTITVSGTGATFNTSATLTIGAFGSGSFSASNGASISTASSILGSSTGSNGTATLSGAGSQWDVQNSLTIGYDGDGTFTVSDGATLTVGGGIYIGYYEGQGVFNVSGGSTVTSGEADFGYYSDNGKGTANISGAGTTWAIDGDLTLGDEGGAGEMNITSGAHISVTGDLEMGVYDEEITRGDLSISGAGSQLVVNGDGYIGYERPAIVTVSSGALLQIDGDTFISRDDTAPSTVTVTGLGSQFNTSLLYVGDYGEGTLNILDGAAVTSGTAYVGNHSDGVGTILIDAATWNLGSSTLVVGQNGTGTVTVQNGGQILDAGQIYIGEVAGSSGTLTVTGAGSQAYANSGLYVGRSGEGALSVVAGGLIETGYLYAGYSSGSDGTVLISGAGSHVLANYGAYIGYNGVGTGTVRNGGWLEVDSSLSVGDSAQGSLIVTGPTSRVTTSSYMTVGGSANGSLTISNGAKVIVDDGNSTATFGSNGGMTGTLVVTGEGSELQSDWLILGHFGIGVATISNGGKITADQIRLGYDNGFGDIGDGTLNIGAAAADPAAAPGIVDATLVRFGGGNFGSGNGRINFNLLGSFAFTPELVGNGDLNVIAGTTTFTTDSTNYSGDVAVTGGKAVFNAILPGDVTVSGSGIVGGSGTIASLDAQSGGTVAPGNSPGTLNVTGNVSFASGSTYTVEVANAAHDLINAGGSAVLTGGLVQASGSPTLMRYTILTAATGVTGTFDSVDTTSAFILYSLDYDPNNVYLVIDGFNSLTTAARTQNQYAVARALDQFPADSPLYSTIIAGSISNAQQAFNALSGEIHASVGTALADDSRYVREAITGRLIQAYYGGGAGGAGGGQPIVLAAAAPQDVATIDTSPRMSLGSGYGSSNEAPAGGHQLAYWSRAFGAWGQYDTNGNAATTDRNLGGFITGVDGGLGGGWRAGLATGYMHTGLSVDDRFSSAQINSYVLGGYAGGALGHGFALRSGGTWTWNDIDTSRNVVFQGFNEFEGASYNGDVGQLFAELAYPVFTHGGVIEPFAGLAYVHVGTDGFTESGPIAGLASGGLDMGLGYGTLGARAGTTVFWGGTTIIPHASLAWQYAFGDTTPQQPLAFASTGIGMGIGGVPLAQNSALVEVGADALIAQEATLGLSYIGQYSGDFTDSGLRGRFNWKF